jgi:formylglycine-generating enzyme required for sulfatase activity/tRNA A-37 threonylcarbamoyl transferase component Bud32
MLDENKLHAVLVDYVDRAVTGDAPDSEAYLAQHADLAQQLQKYFATLALLERLAEGDGRERRRVAHYRLLSRLGSGGNGAVYLARDEKLDRLVAVKVLRGGVLTATPAEVKRFRREADLALRHPNIAAVYEAGDADGVYYLVLQYVAGPSLRQVIDQLAESTPLEELGRVDWRDVIARLSSGDPAPPVPAVDRDRSYYFAVASVAADLAEALDHAHAKQVIHRDVKPDNVLVDAEGDPYLTDFGLAKITGGAQVSQTRDVAGTAEYMSPEMSAAQPTDGRTDVYSLGATLYALLTLRPPYSGPAHEVRQAIARRPPPRIAQLNPYVPRDLQAIAETAMARDVRRRYPSAREMAADLRRWLTFQPVRAKPETALQRARAWVARNKAIAAAVVVLLIAAGWATRAVWIETARGRLVDSGIAKLNRGAPIAAAIDLGQALEMREDASLQHVLELALGISHVTVRCTPAGAAKVTLTALHAVTGLPDPDSKLIGFTDASTGELTFPLSTGQWRITVDRAGFGWGEYQRLVARGQEPFTVEAELRPTAEVTADMIEIPGGSYWIGADLDGKRYFDKERQLVEVQPFFIDRCEVSNADYARFVAATGHLPPAHWASETAPKGKEDLPVTGVTWADAMFYAEWAGKRLPTEDEWEIAARGPHAFRFAWGNDYEPTRANVGPLRDSTQPEQLVSGGPFPVDAPTEDKGPFGVLHMTGNVREWVWDPWQPRKEAAERFPPLLPRGQRVLRGSSCYNLTSEWEISASYRQPITPDHFDVMTGFRCAKSRTASHP